MEAAIESSIFSLARKRLKIPVVAKKKKKKKKGGVCLLLIFPLTDMIAPSFNYHLRGNARIPTKPW